MVTITFSRVHRLTTGTQEEPRDLISICTPPAVARYAGIADEEGGVSMHEGEPTTGQGPPDGDETASDRRKQAEDGAR